jgi:coatomer subunit beta
VNRDGSLKDEMILVCNSLRNDLLHANEFLRGRTLKLVSRIMYKGVLEPLSSAIVENLEHKHTYVRRNAIVALYNIFLNFGDDLIPDIDEYMQKILLNETDLSTKRNAFLLLFHANQQKALDYLNTLITNNQAEDMGDIM